MYQAMIRNISLFSVIVLYSILLFGAEDIITSEVSFRDGVISPDWEQRFLPKQQQKQELKKQKKVKIVAPKAIHVVHPIRPTVHHRKTAHKKQAVDTRPTVTQPPIKHSKDMSAPMKKGAVSNDVPADNTQKQIQPIPQAKTQPKQTKKPAVTPKKEKKSGKGRNDYLKELRKRKKGGQFRNRKIQ